MTQLASGSEVRDHLANERTLLAWLRTGMALMAFGVALAKSALLLAYASGGQATPSPQSARWMATFLIGLGVAFCALGLRRTIQWNRTFANAPTRPHDRGLQAASLAMLALGAVMTVWIWR